MIALALATLLGCRQAPTEALTWQEHWEILGITDDGGVIDGRAEIDNLGLLRGQGHLAFDRWRDEDVPILYGRDAAPGATEVSEDRDAVRVGPDTLGQGEEGAWYLRFATKEASASVRVTPRLGVLAPAPVTRLIDHGQWTVAAAVPDGDLAGWVEAGSRGGILLGRAVVLHRGGDGLPQGPRQAIFVFGDGLALGLHHEGGETLAWGSYAGEALDTAGASFVRDERGHVRLRIGAIEGTIRPRRPQGRTDTFAHLLGPERLALAAFGQLRSRELQRGFAELRIDGNTLNAPALILSEEADP